MMLLVQACACWAWWMPATDRSASALRVVLKSVAEIASGFSPAASAGPITSVCHQSASVWAIRRRLSPWTRSRRSIAIGRKPALTWASTNAAAASSPSRTRSCGSGTDEPDTSRITVSRLIGTPVRSLRSSKVTSLSAENRS